MMEYNPFAAAMLRGNVYAKGKNTPENRDKLRAVLCRHAGRLIGKSPDGRITGKSPYKAGKVGDTLHRNNIKKLADAVTKECGAFLLRKRFRIGTAQKYLNMKLKKMWCEGAIKAPPHCPFDKRIIDALPAAALRGVCRNWTHSDDIADYKAWVDAFHSNRENLCAKVGLRGKKATLSAWEFHYWQPLNKRKKKKPLQKHKKAKKARRKKA